MLVLLFVLFLIPLTSYAAVIETVEWESKPGAPWGYSPGAAGVPTIDASPCGGVPSPSGGSALRLVYPAGTYSTSTGAGTAGIVLSTSQNELYLGHWNCYSSGFVFNLNGTKMDFFLPQNADPATGQRYNYACGWLAANGQIGCTNQILWGNQTINRYCNLGTCARPTNQWYWVEWRVKVNTPGQANGELELWVDDVAKMLHTNVQLLNTNQTGGLNAIIHTGTWGGGGGTIPSTQYWWIDHTVISTTRIGRPVVGGDTTPPRSPANFTAY